MQGYRSRADRDTRVETLFDFFGCHFHGCEVCRPDYSKMVIADRASKVERQEGNAARRLPPEVVRNPIIRRQRWVEAHGYEYVVIWEHEWDADKAALVGDEKQAFKQKKKDTEKKMDYGALKHREGMYGGRCEPFRLLYKCKSIETIRHLDVSGLYPHVLIGGSFTVSHPRPLTGVEMNVFQLGDRQRQIDLIERYVPFRSGRHEIQRGVV